MNDTHVQIALTGVSKSYGNHSILKNVNLQIHEGDFICIFGKSGSGKTTLLNILGTLESYETGEMVCFGKKNPIQKEKTCELLRRNKIAYLFQNFALVEKMSVWENMSLAAKYGKYKDHGARIRKTLGYMGVADKLKSKVYELSGGEQQRVAIARNMVKPFDIMLADEPTGSLDAENKAIVMNALMELNKAGKTIVVVSHDMDFRRIAGISYGIENACLQELN